MVRFTPYLLDVHRSKVHAILRLGDVVVDDVLVLADEGGGGCGGEEAGGGICISAFCNFVFAHVLRPDFLALWQKFDFSVVCGRQPALLT